VDHFAFAGTGRQLKRFFFEQMKRTEDHGSVLAEDIFAEATVMP